jgi:hypothetical protein
VTVTETPTTRDKVPSLRPRWRAYALIFVSMSLFLFGLQQILVRLLLNGPNDRAAAPEAGAVAMLKKLTDLESKYSVSHEDKGFSCELGRLAQSTSDSGVSDPDSVFTTGTHKGYRFALRGCETDSSGRIIRYQLVALPLRPSSAGIRAFCLDQTGILWYDPTGSAERCLASHQVLE